MTETRTMTLTLTTTLTLTQERMETPLAISEHNPRTLRNKSGNYPKWMSKTKVDNLKKVTKKKKAVKKLAKKKAKV